MNNRLSTATDPQWYKDAIIYQLHVKSFFDSNNDGVGDFKGLISKLDYIASLGVNTIWLLPFYPSPRRDDGYDIADYRGIHTEYGTISDMRAFIHEAHKREMRVITELVINHTSDQHPWFQRARLAKPGSAYRNFYVWSKTDKKYEDTRIIFLDSEKSNWSWDEQAGAFYWHRFYHHQPDLNFDNPQVVKEILKIMRYWLDLGIDGLRLDAVPYLIERDGTNNENLPETHAILRQIRTALDAHAPGRMLLAEANQWPEDAQKYFGDGDECHMAFHFPLMPRMYMAIAQEDRFPITDIMRQTPDIPEHCQWAIFLRNHDELTLEMVTDSERDYLWSAYAADKRARINLGIRRRLSPLMDHDRRRVELMNGLLLSMPGTPVIYYGDEIGMGDNIHLGDRDGVRTPMQWSPDRNGGFSRANPADLVLPPVMDAISGYDAVNVERQAADQYSLLNWMRRMLTVRKRHKAFGRGTQEFIYPANRKILAFLRRFTLENGEEEKILCVYNLSRTAQAVELDLSAHEGMVPVDLIGGSGFPAIGQLTYLLTLPPFGFYWFTLATEEALPPWHVKPSEPLPDLATLVVRDGLKDMVKGQARHMLENIILPSYFIRRRWFSGKDKAIKQVSLRRVERLSEHTHGILLTEVEMKFDNRTECYNLPLAISWDGETNSPLPAQLALARVRQGRRMGYLTDAFAVDSFSVLTVQALRTGLSIQVPGGKIRCIPEASFPSLAISETPVIHRLSAEQSNSSLIVDQKIVLKLIRRMAPGINPEVEMLRHLTKYGYANTPALLGEIAMVQDEDEAYSLVVAQAFLENQGDAWQYTIGYLNRLINSMDVDGRTEEDESDQLNAYANFARAIGTRLAQLHKLLAQPSNDPAFMPEVVTAEHVESWSTTAMAQVDAAMTTIEQRSGYVSETAAEASKFLSRHRKIFVNLLPHLAAKSKGNLATRIHGDFHLGQILVTAGDAWIIDFEGEPAKSVTQRRIKSSPARDIAGLSRSFDYATAAVLQSSITSKSDNAAATLARFCDTMHTEFVESYNLLNPGIPLEVIDLFLIEKAAYEICYEAANRPGWIGVPICGLAKIVARVLKRDSIDA
ncbi:MAG: maltose alpha-D-glucosyltransferase [Rhodospirillales bacterium]|nr:maltose alpha-D-glucosyltransferase [Rhodospirillales bacterium]